MVRLIVGWTGCGIWVKIVNMKPGQRKRKNVRNIFLGSIKALFHDKNCFLKEIFLQFSLERFHMNASTKISSIFSLSLAWFHIYDFDQIPQSERV